MEPSKTECPFCGLVWQEHTINEVGGCMAIMHIEFSVAVARDAKLQGKPESADREVVLCPVCGETSEEHTENDVSSCLSKWRKREQGATGLKLQGEFFTAHFENEEPDPMKRAQMSARMLQRLCSCGKARGDHTVDEIRACAERNRSNAGDRS
jgi:hypothetical protein